MFTKKPEDDVGSTEPAKPADRSMESTGSVVSEAVTSTAAKPSSFAKGSSKMVPSIIGEDLTVTGNIISKGEVQVEGEIQGDIHCTSLVIGDKAQITGGVVAEDVVVRGRVVGSIRGVRVTLQTSSHVEGDVYHQSLAIEQGAFFEGKSRRSDDPIANKNEASARPDTGSGDRRSGDKTATAPRAAE